MADDAPNTLSPGTRVAPPAAGDVPERLRRRYFTDDMGGPGLGFYVDATVKIAAFRDRGRELVAPRADPNVIRDMVAIAQHRGWSIVSLRGAPAFRRESWLAASAAGLEVRGYSPTERDLQDLTRRLKARARQRQRDQPDLSVALARRRVETEPGPQSRLKIVETVVRARVTNPDAQARILTAARERLANWLDRGAHFDDLDVGRHRAGHRERRR
jgi:hypothetical protein